MSRSVGSLVWAQNNGVIAITREVHALTIQNFPGTRLHNPVVPLFTFASREACEAAEQIYGSRVYTGTFADIDILLGEGWRSRHHEFSEWHLSEVSEWPGYVPFSNGIYSIAEAENKQSRWHIEVSYRTTAIDLVYAFFDGDLEKYKKVSHLFLRR